jgi:hypothetical protein
MTDMFSREYLCAAVWLSGVEAGLDHVLDKVSQQDDKIDNTIDDNAAKSSCFGLCKRKQKDNGDDEQLETDPAEQQEEEYQTGRSAISTAADSFMQANKWRWPRDVLTSLWRPLKISRKRYSTLTVCSRSSRHNC